MGKRSIVFRLIAFTAFFFICHNASAQQVTFQGVIERGPGTLSDLEVQGRLEVEIPKEVSPWGRVSFDTVEYPFTIPAGYSRTTYSITVPLTQANIEIEEPFVYLSVWCETNCEETNSYAGADPEGYGIADGNNSYIADLTLHRKYDYVSGFIQLPGGKVANTDIELELIFDTLRIDPTPGTKSSPVITRLPQTLVIKAGEAATEFTEKVYYPTRRFSLPISTNWWVWHSIGYQCKSESCKEHGLSENGWLSNLPGESNLTTTTAINSRTYELLFDDYLSVTMGTGLTAVNLENGWYRLNQPITMVENLSIPASVVLNQNKKSSNQIQGRVIAYKEENEPNCGSVGWRTNSAPGLECIAWDTTRRSRIIAESSFTIDAGSSSTEIEIELEPLEQLFNRSAPWPLPSGLNHDESVFYDYQYIAVVCDSGCEDFDSDDIAYLGNNRKYLALSSSAAKKFYTTESLLEDELVIYLARYKLLPFLDLLLEEESTNLNIDE